MLFRGLRRDEAIRDAAVRDTGLSHLEGRDVAVLADGNVIHGLTVENGKITLKHPASVVHVGLPYRAELETLDLTLPRQDGTQQGRSARLISVSVRVEKTRGIKIGRRRAILCRLRLWSSRSAARSIRRACVAYDWRYDARAERGLFVGQGARNSGRAAALYASFTASEGGGRKWTVGLTCAAAALRTALRCAKYFACGLGRDCGGFGYVSRGGCGNVI